MEVTIRKAGMENLKEIQRISQMFFKHEHALFDNTLDLKWTYGNTGTKYFTDRITKKNSCAFIAVSDEKVVGYITGSLSKMESWRKKITLAELENVYVLKKYRSRGIGTKLYSEFLSWCRKKRALQLRVNSLAGNHKAMRFYKKNGFKEHDVTLEKEIKKSKSY